MLNILRSVSDQSSNSKINNFGHRRRLRERFLKTGLSGFSDHEVVELLLTIFIPRKDVKNVAKQALSKFSSLKGIFDAEVKDLMAINGIGEKSAISIKIIKAIHCLYFQQSCEDSVFFDDFEKVSKIWKARMSGLTFEVLEVAYLGQNLQLLKDGIERLENGTASSVSVYPRKIAEAAIMRHASAIILAHNHPKGTACPSDYDERVTRKIKSALQFLDIKLVDHIIIAGNDVFSFVQNNIL